MRLGGHVDTFSTLVLLALLVNVLALHIDLPDGLGIDVPDPEVPGTAPPYDHEDKPVVRQEPLPRHISPSGRSSLIDQGQHANTNDVDRVHKAAEAAARRAYAAAMRSGGVEEERHSPIKEEERTPLQAVVRQAVESVTCAGDGLINEENAMGEGVRISDAVARVAVEAGASEGEARDLACKEQESRKQYNCVMSAQARQEAAVFDEKCKERAADIASLEATKRQAERKQAQVNVALEAVKREAAAVAARKAKARADLAQAQLEKKMALLQEKEMIVTEEACDCDKKTEKKKTDAVSAQELQNQQFCQQKAEEQCKRKKECEDVQKAAGILRAQIAEKARCAAYKAYALVRKQGRSEDCARVAAMEVKEKIEHAGARKAKELKRKVLQKLKSGNSLGCSGWSPSTGPLAGQGGMCHTWGRSKRWCWVMTDYRGPGHEFMMLSDLYPGKLYAPCAATGKWLSKYDATWAATGCPSIQPPSFFKQFEAEDRSDVSVFRSMYFYCKTRDESDQARTICCGDEVNARKNCNAVCQLQTTFTLTNGVKQQQHVLDESSTSSSYMNS